MATFDGAALSFDEHSMTYTLTQNGKTTKGLKTMADVCRALEKSEEPAKEKKHMKNSVKVQMENEYVPVRAHADDAGLDLKAPKGFYLWANSTHAVNTGVHIEIPKGYVGMIKSRSSMLKRFIITDGTIDAGYTGEIVVVLMNLGSNGIEIKEGDKIAQLVIQPIITPEVQLVDSLESTDRGDGGFGSTGR